MGDVRMKSINHYWFGLFLLFFTPVVLAAGGMVKGPNVIAPDRYVYYPGTEELGADEIRVIACGTGMPTARRSQAAASWVVELGNGDKFIVDIGSGSMANIQSLMIPANFLTKVFLTHLHTDHWGDFDALWAGGWTAGRTEALKVWGPSGAKPEMGTKAAIDGFMKTFHWDYITRLTKLAAEPGRIEVHEFDFAFYGGKHVFLVLNLSICRALPG